MINLNCSMLAGPFKQTEVGGKVATGTGKIGKRRQLIKKNGTVQYEFSVFMK